MTRASTTGGTCRPALASRPSAGLAAESTAPELGRGFIAFLARPAFTAKFAEAGLDDQP